MRHRQPSENDENGRRPRYRAGSLTLGAAAVVALTFPSSALAQTIIGEEDSANAGDTSCAFRATPLWYEPARENILTAMLCITNNERLRIGLSPVHADPALGRTGQAHTDDMATRRFFDHVNPDNCDPTCRGEALGYPAGIAENIASGLTNIYTAATVVDAWMHSDGHRANILDPGHQGMGGGVSVEPRFHGMLWAQEFGDSAAPADSITGLEPQFQGAPDPVADERKQLWAKQYGPRSIPSFRIRDRGADIWLQVVLCAPHQPVPRLLKIYYPVRVEVVQGSRRRVTTEQVRFVYDGGYLSTRVKLPRARRPATVTIRTANITRTKRYVPYARSSRPPAIAANVCSAQ
jgi:uncharacterized protein YkwD